MVTNYDKAIAAIIVPILATLVAYLSPETIQGIANYVGVLVSGLVVAALTGLAVYLTPNKEKF